MRRWIFAKSWPGVALLIFFSLSAEGSGREPRAFFVSPSGNDDDSGGRNAPLATIQRGLDLASVPGDRVLVRQGTYREKVVFPHSGKPGADICLRAFPNESAILDGTGVAGAHMVLMHNVNYVRISGVQIRNNLDVRDGSGIRVEGEGDHIQILENEIHRILGRNAMGITVYGTSTSRPISNLVIQGNHVHDCEPAPSEALTVNGNVVRFSIRNNLVHDVNNIGIDVIGGERDINPDPDLVARSGVVANNMVFHARSSYGGGYAAGIYVDGGRNVTVENNEVFECDLGIEVGAENPGTVTSRVFVQNNLVHHNDKVGIVFGGYQASVGRVERCRFLNNTLYKNDVLDEGYGQLWVSYASFNRVANNIFYAGDNNVLMYAEIGNTANRYDYNLYFSESGAEDCEFVWRDKSSGSFASYLQKSGQDVHSGFSDPRLKNPDQQQYWLRANSPAIDAGSGASGWFAPYDFRGRTRPLGENVDIGAYEF